MATILGIEVLFEGAVWVKPLRWELLAAIMIGCAGVAWLMLYRQGKE